MNEIFHFRSKKNTNRHQYTKKYTNKVLIKVVMKSIIFMKLKMKVLMRNYNDRQLALCNK